MRKLVDQIEAKQMDLSERFHETFKNAQDINFESQELAI
jgi:hypothetical protein